MMGLPSWLHWVGWFVITILTTVSQEEQVIISMKSNVSGDYDLCDGDSAGGLGDLP